MTHIYDSLSLASCLAYRLQQAEKLYRVIDLLPDDVQGNLRPLLANKRVGHVGLSAREIEDDIDKFGDEQDTLRRWGQ
jgi:hypothetical protein